MSANLPALLDRKALLTVANHAGGELLPDNAQYTNRFQIKSSSSTRLYIVSQIKKTGEWRCSCPRCCTNPARTCKHLDAIRPALQAASVPRPASLPGRGR